MQIVWSQSAQRDFREQVFYLAERNPAAARSVRTAVREAVGKLTDFPHRGRPGRRNGTRELVIAGLPYVVIYAVGNVQLTILRVLHAAQDWPPETE